MKLEVEQIDMEREEEVIVRCHDVGADWGERKGCSALAEAV